MAMSLILQFSLLERLIGRPFHRLTVLRLVLWLRDLHVLTTGRAWNSLDFLHGLERQSVDANFVAFTGKEVRAAFVAELHLS